MAKLICSVDEGVLNYVVHTAFSVSPDPYPSGATVGSYGKTLDNVENNATVTIKASETTCRSNYTFPVDVYTSTDGKTWGERIDYLQSGQVTFSAGSGTKYVKVGPATKGSSSDDSYKIKVVLGDGIAQVAYKVNDTNLSSNPSLVGADFTVDVGKGGYVYISIARYSAHYTHPVTASASSGMSKWTVVDENGEYSDHKISAPSSPGTRTVTLTATTHWLTAGGSFPAHIEEIKFTDGTFFTVSNKSVGFTSSKAIKSIALTDTAENKKWTGKLYWSSSAGGKTYLIASIDKGVVSMASSIETISYEGKERTIYFTEDGDYPYREVYLRVSNGVKSCRIKYTNGMTDTTSTLILDTTEKKITPKTDTSISIDLDSVTYNSINSQNCRNAKFELWKSDGTFNSHLESTSYSVTGTAADSSIYLRVGAETPISIYTSGGLWSDNRSSQPKIYWRRIYGTLNLSEPSGMITREGYVLLGWSKGSGAYIPGYTTADEVQLLTNGPFSFYAVWGINLFLQCGEGTKEITLKIGSWKTIGIANQDFEKVAVPLNDDTDTTKLIISAIPTTGYERPMQVTFKNGPQGQILTRVTISETSQSYSYANDAIHQKHNYVVVNFVPKLELFTWCGNDTLDDKNITAGQPVSNLTADAWNRYKTSLSTIKAKWGLTDIYPGNDVDQNDAITAEEFNKLTKALRSISSQKSISTNYIPFDVEAGDTIKASFFNKGENDRDLKHAINYLINQIIG